jgi:hypothetical protein
VKQNNELQVSELLELLSTNKYEQAKFLPYVWKLAFEDVLSVDYENMPLNMNSVIRYKHE